MGTTGVTLHQGHSCIRTFKMNWYSKLRVTISNSGEYRPFHCPFGNEHVSNSMFAIARMLGVSLSLSRPQYSRDDRLVGTLFMLRRRACIQKGKPMSAIEICLTCVIYPIIEGREALHLFSRGLTSLFWQWNAQLLGRWDCEVVEWQSSTIWTMMKPGIIGERS